MAKNKKGKNGGKGKTNTRQRPQQPAWKADFVKASGAYLPPDDLEQTTFTLRDAARNSAHPTSYFSNSTLSLRHKTMNFVRGEELVQDDLAKLPRHVQDPHDNLQSNIQAGQPQIQDPLLDRESEQDNGMDLDGNASMPDDLDSSRRLSPKQTPMSLPIPQQRPPPSPSDSDDEVVFVGRNHLKERQQGQLQSPAKDMIAARQITPPPQPGEDVPESQHEPTNAAVDANSSADVWEDVSDDEDDYSPKKDRAGRKPRKSSRRNLRRQRQRSKIIMASSANADQSTEDLLDDYVENMRANGELPEEPDQEMITVALKETGNGWNSDEIQDFGDISTSEEILEAVESILSKRQRPSGLQYLVVWQGQSIDEARWIPVSSLTMPGAAAIIEAFEEEEKQIAQYAAEEAYSDESDDVQVKWSSDSEDSELEEELDDYLDEEDLIERRIARMTDEHIARLLQKQESLGIHSSDLQIFDGIGLSDDEPGAFSKKRSKKRRRRHEQALFDAEEALELAGDDYGDFDVTDFDRTSLKQTKHSQPDYLETLSDEDMAQTLRDAWATDRKKKCAKKLEREELRAQGLLGKKYKNKPDLKARYKEGMSIDQLYDEIEDFLLNGQQEELSLPPMAKQERKAIHEVSRPFGLKSKSQGSGKQRFTILYKTSRTAQLDLDDTDFSRLRRQLNRRFLPRMDAKKKGPGNVKGRPGEASYRDGDIVGAGASEIGAENRGRAMLEKMGWSSGTALGALNNQGILMPIQHVVKNSKAGLG